MQEHNGLEYSFHAIHSDTHTHTHTHEQLTYLYAAQSETLEISVLNLGQRDRRRFAVNIGGQVTKDEPNNSRMKTVIPMIKDAEPNKYHN